MPSKIFTLETLEETKKLGFLLGKIAVAGDVYALDGDLGSGKTTITQSIARGVEVPEIYHVTSPSFNVFHEYPGRIPLYHMDFYRLVDENDVIDMGLDEYFYLHGLTVLEWPLKAAAILPDYRLLLTIVWKSEYVRSVLFDFHEKYWLKRIHELFHLLERK